MLAAPSSRPAEKSCRTRTFPRPRRPHLPHVSLHSQENFGLRSVPSLLLSCGSTGARGRCARRRGAVTRPHAHPWGQPPCPNTQLVPYHFSHWSSSQLSSSALDSMPRGSCIEEDPPVPWGTRSHPEADPGPGSVVGGGMLSAGHPLPQCSPWLPVLLRLLTAQPGQAH